jgi:hypothetical protein
MNGLKVPEFCLTLCCQPVLVKLIVFQLIEYEALSNPEVSNNLPPLKVKGGGRCNRLTSTTLQWGRLQIKMREDYSAKQ